MLSFTSSCAYVGGIAPALHAVSQVREKGDLDARLEFLGGFKFEDPGPVFDVVAWHDGNVWRAAVDTGAAGDLTNAPGLASYNIEGKFASFGKEEQLNYTLTVFDEGAVVNICATGGAHGTHVAGIIGAYRPDA